MNEPRWYFKTILSILVSFVSIVLLGPEYVQGQGLLNNPMNGMQTRPPEPGEQAAKIKVGWRLEADQTVTLIMHFEPVQAMEAIQNRMEYTLDRESFEPFLFYNLGGAVFRFTDGDPEQNPPRAEMQRRYEDFVARQMQRTPTIAANGGSGNGQVAEVDRPIDPRNRDPRSLPAINGTNSMASNGLIANGPSSDALTGQRNSPLQNTTLPPREGDPGTNGALQPLGGRNRTSLLDSVAGEGLGNPLNRETDWNANRPGNPRQEMRQLLDNSNAAQAGYTPNNMNDRRQRNESSIGNDYLSNDVQNNGRSSIPPPSTNPNYDPNRNYQEQLASERAASLAANNPSFGAGQPYDSRLDPRANGSGSAFPTYSNQPNYGGMSQPAFPAMSNQNAPYANATYPNSTFPNSGFQNGPGANYLMADNSGRRPVSYSGDQGLDSDIARDQSERLDKLATAIEKLADDKETKSTAQNSEIVSPSDGRIANSSTSKESAAWRSFLGFLFVLSVVVNCYLMLMIGKLLQRYRTLLSSVRTGALA